MPKQKQSCKAICRDFDVVQKLQAEFANIQERYNVFRWELGTLAFKSKEGDEFINQGFARRVGIMRRCIGNIFRICPPNIDSRPSSEELCDLSINLQAFILNAYGSLDNLAWVWVKERNVVDENNRPLPKQRIGFSEKYRDVRKSFSLEFQTYLMTKGDWFAQLEDFRHALAHRIPLYIPPCKFTKEEGMRFKELFGLMRAALQKHDLEEHKRLTDELEALGTFVPIMTHSYAEPTQNIAIFHDQIIRDWKTVMEIWEHFLKEMKR